MTRLTDEQIDGAIGIILRTGVIIAALFVAGGGVGYLWTHANVAPQYAKFRGAPANLTHISAIVRDVVSLQPRFVIQFGLILLMATPVVRVIACALGFGIQRDWKYVVVSLVVLTFLLISLIGHSG